MCAIGGEIDYARTQETKDDEYYRAMLDSMSRRGPDQNGMHRAGHAALLHARLSVIDIEHGRQPMTALRDGYEITLVYNGELYNTEEIRRELQQLGYEFSGHSDTEVLLKAYLAWEEGCVARLNGIFAFAIWDAKTQRLFIARDRMGVKPFFYAWIGGCFVFASELKTILLHPQAKAEIDRNGILELLLLGPGRTPGCGVFRGIHELLPASCGFLSRDGLQIWPYWRVADRVHEDSFQITAAKVRALVEDAIRRQLVSDVPICTLLSGGLDSSLISSVAAAHLRERGERLTTFSVFYEDNEKFFQPSRFQPDSDTGYIEAMKRYLDCDNHRITIGTEALVDALFEAVEARDLPGMADVDASLLLFCREIKKQCTVALSGECADEIFGGYPWFRDKTVRASKGFPWAQSTLYRASFLREEIAREVNAEDFVGEKYRVSAAGADVSLTDSIEERQAKVMSHINLYWFMQTLLDRKDRMSMYSGLEVRVPFCDHRIAEYLYGVPWPIKNHNGFEKGLLREAACDLLPESVLWRKKNPYPKTHNPAYFTAVKERLNELLCCPNDPLFDLVSRKRLRELTASTLQTPWYGQLMTVPQTIAYFLQMSYWLKRYRVQICPSASDLPPFERK